MRQTLMSAFPDDSIGMGGTFVVLSGKVKIHIMPDFCPRPIHSDEQVDEWLKFYDMRAPFVCGSTFVANDPVS